MTDEEKKAIERIEKKILTEECKKVIRVPIYISDLKTILNLIQKQQAELEKKEKIIEYWKNGFERELESNRENVIEIIKKDKIIDKMAFLIASKISSKAVVCNNMNCDKGIAIECKDCIIKYFEKKDEGNEYEK